MTEFRKKPVVIEAWQWNESLILCEYLRKRGMKWNGHNGHVTQPDLCKNLRIKTLEGSLTVQPGDWIIRGVKGEFYPCKPDIFAATYEPADKPHLERGQLTEEEYSFLGGLYSYLEIHNLGAWNAKIEAIVRKATSQSTEGT